MGIQWVTHVNNWIIINHLIIDNYQKPCNTTSNNHNHNIIWLVVLTTLKNMNVNGKDYPIYYGKSVPNHQPAIVIVCYS